MSKERVRIRRDKLVELLSDSRISQNAWAMRLGISRSYLSELVNGKRQYPSKSVRRRMLAVLDLDFDDLFERDGRIGTVSRERLRRNFTATTGDRPRLSEVHFMSAVMVEVRQALRQLFKTPGFSLPAVLLLTIGIGANTAVFSLISGILMEGLPFPNASELVAIREVNARGLNSVSPANFVDWRQGARSFRGLAAFNTWSPVLTELGDPVNIPASFVSADFFDVLAVSPILGATFRHDPTVGEDLRAVVLSHRSWTHRFGADPAVVGTSIRLNDHTFEIVGVMPDGFDFPSQREMWVPMNFDFDIAESRGAHFLGVVGRLNGPDTLQQAEQELNVICARLAADYPATNDGVSATLMPLFEAVVGDVRTGLLVALGTVVLMLLITTANLANLLLARGARRSREMAIRVAVGAGRRHLLRLLLTEGLLLSAVGSLAGVALAYILLPGLLSLLPPNFPMVDRVSINGSVLAFAALLCGGTTLLFALLPTLQATRYDVRSMLSLQGAGAGSDHANWRARRALVVAEVAVCVTLVLGAGLFIRTFGKLQGVDPGFVADDVLSMRIDLPSARYPDAAAINTFYGELTLRLAETPGVDSVGGTAFLPLGGAWSFSLEKEGAEPVKNSEKHSTVFKPIRGDYFTTMGIPLLAGRLFGPLDRPDSPPVVIINETLAKRHFPDGDAIGQRIIIGYGRGEPQAREIVGVVADVRQWALSAPPPPISYVPHPQTPFSFINIVLKGEKDSLLQRAKLRIWDLDPQLAVSQVQFLEERLVGSVSGPRFRMLLVGSVAGLAWLIAIFGVYALVSYSVSQRISEIGIRMALGAQRRDILGMVLRTATVLATIGVVLGLLVSRGLAQFVNRLLFAVSATDWTNYVASAFVVILACLIAALVPALRATRVDPTRAVRSE